MTVGEAVECLLEHSTSKERKKEAVGVLINDKGKGLRYLNKHQLRCNYEVITGYMFGITEYRYTTKEDLIYLLTVWYEENGGHDQNNKR